MTGPVSSACSPAHPDLSQQPPWFCSRQHHLLLAPVRNPGIICVLSHPRPHPIKQQILHKELYLPDSPESYHFSPPSQPCRVQAPLISHRQDSRGPQTRSQSSYFSDCFLLSQLRFLPLFPWASVLFLDHRPLTPILGPLPFLCHLPEMLCVPLRPHSYSLTSLRSQGTGYLHREASPDHWSTTAPYLPVLCCTTQTDVHWSLKLCHCCVTSTQHRAWMQQRLIRLWLKERGAEGLRGCLETMKTLSQLQDAEFSAQDNSDPLLSAYCIPGASHR